MRESQGASRIVGAVGAHDGLRSRRTVAGTPADDGEVSGSATHPDGRSGQGPDFVTVSCRLRALRTHYKKSQQRAKTGVLDELIARSSRKVLLCFENFLGRVDSLEPRPSSRTNAEQAYIALQEWAGQAEKKGNPVFAGAIRSVLDSVDQYAVDALHQLFRDHGTASVPFNAASQRQQVSAANIPPPAIVLERFDWLAAYRQVHSLADYFSTEFRNPIAIRLQEAAFGIGIFVTAKFCEYGGKIGDLSVPGSGSLTRPELAYRTLLDKHRRAVQSGDTRQANQICLPLAKIHEYTSNELKTLVSQYGSLDALVSKAGLAGRRQPKIHGLPGTDTATEPPVSTTSPGNAGPPAYLPDDSERHAATGLPEPSPYAAAGIDAGDFGYRRPGRPVPTTTAPSIPSQPLVTPPLQPVDPVPAPGTVQFGPGLHRAGNAVQPPPVFTTGAATVTPSYFPAWVGDNFAVERALIDGILPTGFDASRLIAEAGRFGHLGLAGDLSAGRLPTVTVDAMLVGHEATDEQGCNAPVIEFLQSLKESIEFDLRTTYASRADPEWLEQVRHLLHARGELPAARRLQTGSAGALGCSSTRPGGILDDLYWFNDATQTDLGAAADMADLDWSAIGAPEPILDIPTPSPDPPAGR